MIDTNSDSWQRELQEFSDLVDKCKCIDKCIDDVVREFGPPYEEIPLREDNSVVQYRFRGDWELLTLVAICRSDESIELIAEPRE
ncbi:MAG: hypothetical protein R3C18_16685 [Planctomycetaceae bacterium]